MGTVLFWITTEKIIGVSLSSVMDIYITPCFCKATSVVDDLTHPSHTLYGSPLPEQATRLLKQNSNMDCAPPT